MRTGGRPAACGKPATKLPIAAIVAVCLLTLAGCGGRLQFEAVQTFYTEKVPHTDRRGRTLSRYDPDRSFLPLVMYHGLSGEHHGIRYRLDNLARAGFNAVHPWERQEAPDFAARAQAAGLQVIVHGPDDADVAALADSPALLAWYLDEEPSFLYPADETEQRLAMYAQKRDAIRRRDPDTPIFVLDGPPTTENLTRWRRWNALGDITSHFDYPVTVERVRDYGPVERVAETTAMARRLVGGSKPVWIALQAFGGEERGWYMPQPETLRAMAYAAIVHGATGLIYFAYDSFVTRDDGIIGISPAPRADYGVTVDYNADGKPPLVASGAELARSRELFRAVAALNAELETLKPAILSPTRATGYTVRPVDHGRKDAVRTLLKPFGHGDLLFAVNVDSASATVRFRFARPIEKIVRLFGESDPESVAADGWTDRFPPESVYLYRVEYAP